MNYGRTTWCCYTKKLWGSGNLEPGDTGEKNREHSATIAMQSPLPEYNGHFELGLGQSMVNLSSKLFR
jgi:hypothetical protein